MNAMGQCDSNRSRMSTTVECGPTSWSYGSMGVKLLMDDHHTRVRAKDGLHMEAMGQWESNCSWVVNTLEVGTRTGNRWDLWGNATQTDQGWSIHTRVGPGRPTAGSNASMGVKPIKDGQSTGVRAKHGQDMGVMDQRESN